MVGVQCTSVLNDLQILYTVKQILTSISLLHATDKEGGEKMEFENIYDEKTRIQLKDEFPQLSDVTYLDHAGATLFSKTQIESVTAELRENLFFNVILLPFLRLEKWENERICPF